MYIIAPDIAKFDDILEYRPALMCTYLNQLYVENNTFL